MFVVKIGRNIEKIGLKIENKCLVKRKNAVNRNFERLI